MFCMKPLSGSILAILLLLTGGAALAQNPNAVIGGPPPIAPPPPPPPPSTAVPVVPKMDVPSPQYSGPNYGYNNGPPPRSSFHERVTRCLDEAAAAGIRPADRAAYSRACANQ